MRTLGVKNSNMLRNVVGNKMSKRIQTIGNKMMPYQNSFSQIMPTIMGLKNLSISNKKSLYEKRKK
jgi:hypothetical protein